MGDIYNKRPEIYEKIQELIILLHHLCLTIYPLQPEKSKTKRASRSSTHKPPTAWEIKNEESIQVFNPHIVDTRDTGQYMSDDQSDWGNQVNSHWVNIN